MNSSLELFKEILLIFACLLRCSVLGRDVVVVNTAAAFQAAIKNNTQHIEIRKHLNLSAMYDVRARVAMSSEVKSVTGRCRGVHVPKSFMTPGSPPITREANSSHCVLLFGAWSGTSPVWKNLYFPGGHKAGPVWLDHLYLRLTANDDGFDTSRSFIALNLEREAYITNTTIQENGSPGIPTAVWTDSKILMKDCVVRDFNSMWTTIGVSQAASFEGSSFINNTVQNENFTNIGIITQYSSAGAEVKLQRCTFDSNSVRGSGYLSSDGGRFYSDTPTTVAVGQTGNTTERTLPLKDAPDVFLHVQDTWLVHLRQGEPKSNKRLMIIVIAAGCSAAVVVVAVAVAVYCCTRTPPKEDYKPQVAVKQQAEAASDAKLHKAAAAPGRPHFYLSIPADMEVNMRTNEYAVHEDHMRSFQYETNQKYPDVAFRTYADDRTSARQHGHRAQPASKQPWVDINDYLEIKPPRQPSHTRNRHYMDTT